MKRTPKPFFCHHTPYYYDWDGYVNRIFDYASSFTCRVRATHRRKIYVRNFKLYPPKPRTPEEVEASEKAFREAMDSKHWIVDLWNTDLWQRIRSTTSIYDALSGKSRAE